MSENLNLIYLFYNFFKDIKSTYNLKIFIFNQLFLIIENKKF